MFLKTLQQFLAQIRMALNVNQNLSLLLLKNDDQNIQKALKRASERFDIKAYKIEEITKREVLRHYLELEKNNFANRVVIEGDGMYELCWHSKQLKIFVWVLVIYVLQQQADLKKLVFLRLFQNEQQWSFIQSIFTYKNPLLLRFQTRCLLKHQKSSWTYEEDQLLKSTIKYLLFKLRIIDEKTKYYWNQVSKHLFIISGTDLFKSAKQCRQRWFNHLDPNKSKKHWSEEQEIEILQNIQKHGKKWALVAKIMGSHRTGHDIKNRYFSIKKRIENKEALLQSGGSQKKFNRSQASSAQCLFKTEQPEDQELFAEGESLQQLNNIEEEMNSVEIDRQFDEIQEYIEKKGLFILTEQI